MGFDTRIWPGLVLAAAIGAGVSLAAGTAAAADAPLVCVFSQGVVQSYTNGTFASEPASQLSFEVGEIDLERQTAQLITPKGQGELRIVRAIGANHFLEVINEGFLNMTTIYEATTPNGALPAVHSRHVGLMGQPVVAQYTGSCTPKS